MTFASAGAETPGPLLDSDTVQLRMNVEDQMVHYSYSINGGKTFVPFGDKSKMRFSWWKGARPALFSYSVSDSAEPGYADFDSVHIRQIAPERD